MNVLKQVCQEIQMPIAPEKSEGPATVLEFLGLTLDTEQMVIHIPKDKLQDIVCIITKMVKTRKAMSWKLQSLAGKLNFITKAVPGGKFHKTHLSGSGRDPTSPSHEFGKPSALQPLIEVFTDAAGNAKLGWGAWLPHIGLWMHSQWEEEFFHKFQPSIDFLELYGLLAGIVTWAPHLVDHTVLFPLDNTSTVFALRNKSSDIPQMLFLLHFLTLFCVTHNITILVRHVRSIHNKICDKLSLFQFQDFHALKPDHTACFSSTPSNLISPLSACMQRVFFC